jgi:DNA-binding response OmpR family regulator
MAPTMPAILVFSAAATAPAAMASWAAERVLTHVTSAHLIDHALERGPYDFAIVVCDADLAGDGAAIARLRAAPPVFAAVSARMTPDRRRALLRHGADDVFSDSTPLARFDARADELRLAGSHPTSAPPELCRGELNLLNYLCRFPGRVVPQEEIIRNVFGGAHAAGTSLVRVHVARLRRQLGDAGPEILTFRGRGYTVRDRPPLDRPTINVQRY